MSDAQSPTQAFRNARDLLLRHREDYRAALAGFTWPQLDEFNWALDWFDVIAAEHPGPRRAAHRGRRGRRRPDQFWEEDFPDLKPDPLAAQMTDAVLDRDFRL